MSHVLGRVCQSVCLGPLSLSLCLSLSVCLCLSLTFSLQCFSIRVVCYRDARLVSYRSARLYCVEWSLLPAGSIRGIPSSGEISLDKGLEDKTGECCRQESELVIIL